MKRTKSTSPKSRSSPTRKTSPKSSSSSTRRTSPKSSSSPTRKRNTKKTKLSDEFTAEDAANVLAGLSFAREQSGVARADDLASAVEETTQKIAAISESARQSAAIAADANAAAAASIERYGVFEAVGINKAHAAAERDEAIARANVASATAARHAAALSAVTAATTDVERDVAIANAASNRRDAAIADAVNNPDNNFTFDRTNSPTAGYGHTGVLLEDEEAEARIKGEEALITTLIRLKDKGVIDDYSLWIDKQKDTNYAFLSDKSKNRVLEQFSETLARRDRRFNRVNKVKNVVKAGIKPGLATAAVIAAVLSGNQGLNTNNLKPVPMTPQNELLRIGGRNPDDLRKVYSDHLNQNMIKKWENYPEWPGQTADEYTSRNIPKPLTGQTIAQAIKDAYGEIQAAPAAPRKQTRKFKETQKRKQMKQKTKRNKNNLRGRTR